MLSIVMVDMYSHILVNGTGVRMRRAGFVQPQPDVSKFGALCPISEVCVL